MYNYRECGLDNIKLVNGYEIEESPYGSAVSIRNMKELHKAIGLEIINKDGRITNKELRFIRKELGLSQKLLADTLSVTEITVRKWEAGENNINGTADKLLRALYKGSIDPNSPVQEMVAQLAHLDNLVKKSVKQFKFEVTDSHWIRKAAN